MTHSSSADNKTEFQPSDYPRSSNSNIELNIHPSSNHAPAKVTRLRNKKRCSARSEDSCGTFFIVDYDSSKK